MDGQKKEKNIKAENFMDITYHYPPDLFQLLVDTIPLLSRSKKDVLLFFMGAGVERQSLEDLSKRVQFDKENINKYEIARTVITRLNEMGERSLRERRELLKRVIEFEDFSTCWPNDQLKAKGLVGEIRRVIDVKDSFTRMKQEREKERQKSQEAYQARLRQVQKRKDELSALRGKLFSLFSINDPRIRGLELEVVLNSLFAFYGISIRQAFKVQDEETGTTLEQDDGAVELDNEIYLVEMKWTKMPVEVEQVSRHLVRIYHRGFTCGVFISNSGYTEPAIKICKEALQKTVVVLFTLEEIVKMVEAEKDLCNLFKKKVQTAILDKKPFVQISDY